MYYNNNNGEERRVYLNGDRDHPLGYVLVQQHPLRVPAGISAQEAKEGSTSDLTEDDGRVGRHAEVAVTLVDDGMRGVGRGWRGRVHRQVDVIGARVDAIHCEIKNTISFITDHR